MKEFGLVTLKPIYMQKSYLKNESPKRQSLHSNSSWERWMDPTRILCSFFEQEYIDLTVILLSLIMKI
jgi:hypothetical protein